MHIINFYDYIYGTSYSLDPDTFRKLEIFRNVHSLVIATYTAYKLYAYMISSDVQIIYNVCDVIFAQCIVDSFLTKRSDVHVHHWVTFVLIHHSKTFLEYTVIILSTEISTIFLSLREINKLTIKDQTSVISGINDGLFAFTFYYFRIYLYTKHIILSEDINTFPLILSSVAYGMWLLNIYWGILIGKMIMKLFTRTN